MNVSIFVQEFDKSFETHHVAIQTSKDFDHYSVIRSSILLNLSGDVGKDESDKLYNSEDKSTESERSKMISKSSVERSFDGVVGFLSSTEIPNSDSGSKHELGKSIDHSVFPKSSENEVG